MIDRVHAFYRRAILRLKACHGALVRRLHLDLQAAVPKLQILVAAAVRAPRVDVTSMSKLAYWYGVSTLSRMASKIEEKSRRWGLAAFRWALLRPQK